MLGGRGNDSRSAVWGSRSGGCLSQGQSVGRRSGPGREYEKVEQNLRTGGNRGTDSLAAGICAADSSYARESFLLARESADSSSDRCNELFGFPNAIRVLERLRREDTVCSGFFMLRRYVRFVAVNVVVRLLVLGNIVRTTGNQILRGAVNNDVSGSGAPRRVIVRLWSPRQSNTSLLFLKILCFMH